MGAALAPWSATDGDLLAALNGDPAMMAFLGGAETPQKIAERQERYSRPGSCQYRIEVDGARAGWVGYWDREWDGREVHECGWAVLPAFQGRGVAVAAVGLLLELAAAEGTRPAMHAYPKVEHAASNAVACKAGFTLVGEASFEYPPGTAIVVNDWRHVLG